MGLFSARLLQPVWGGLSSAAHFSLLPGLFLFGSTGWLWVSAISPYFLGIPGRKEKKRMFLAFRLIEPKKAEGRRRIDWNNEKAFPPCPAVEMKVAKWCGIRTFPFKGQGLQVIACRVSGRFWTLVGRYWCFWPLPSASASLRNLRSHSPTGLYKWWWEQATGL